MVAIITVHGDPNFQSAILPMVDHDEMDDKTPRTSFTAKGSRQHDLSALRNDARFQRAKSWRSSRFSATVRAFTRRQQRAIHSQRFATISTIGGLFCNGSRHDVVSRQVVHRMVPKYALDRTTNFHFDELKAHKISTKTEDGYIQLFAIKNILKIMDLPICIGVRTKLVTSKDKMSIFINHFQFDPRPLVQTRIATLEFTESSYQQIFYSVSALNPVTPVVTHQVKALVAGKQSCRNFAASKCNYEDTCKYIHELHAGAFSTKTSKFTPKPPAQPAQPDSDPTAMTTIPTS